MVDSLIYSSFKESRPYGNGHLSTSNAIGVSEPIDDDTLPRNLHCQVQVVSLPAAPLLLFLAVYDGYD